MEAPDVSKSILEGIDEILTVVRLGLPLELRRSLASTNIIESMNSVIRRVCRNVKRWRDAKMALRWTSAGMFEAQKGFSPHQSIQATAHSQASSHRSPRVAHPVPLDTSLSHAAGLIEIAACHA